MSVGVILFLFLLICSLIYYIPRCTTVSFSSSLPRLFLTFPFFSPPIPPLSLQKRAGLPGISAKRVTIDVGGPSSTWVMPFFAERPGVIIKIAEQSRRRKPVSCILHGLCLSLLHNGSLPSCLVIGQCFITATEKQLEQLDSGCATVCFFQLRTK